MLAGWAPSPSPSSCTSATSRPAAARPAPTSLYDRAAGAASTPPATRSSSRRATTTGRTAAASPTDGMDPLERLARLREVFFADEWSLGRSRMPTRAPGRVRRTRRRGLPVPRPAGKPPVDEERRGIRHHPRRGQQRQPRLRRGERRRAALPCRGQSRVDRAGAAPGGRPRPARPRALHAGRSLGGEPRQGLRRAPRAGGGGREATRASPCSSSTGTRTSYRVDRPVSRRLRKPRGKRASRGGLRQPRRGLDPGHGRPGRRRCSSASSRGPRRPSGD